jgi:hypothetical protein
MVVPSFIFFRRAAMKEIHARFAAILQEDAEVLPALLKFLDK